MKMREIITYLSALEDTVHLCNAITQKNRAPLLREHANTETKIEAKATLNVDALRR